MLSKSIFLSFCCLPFLAWGQAVDNMASFRMVAADRFVRLHYENDYFTATDYYYTQGINLEIVDPTYCKFPLSKILAVPKVGKRQYGISIEHNGYTPTSIESNAILYGDRPFAASLMLKTFVMTVDGARHRRITSSFSVGVIGPTAGGYEMQKSIHAWIGATEPLGWQFQIQNALILNYEAGIEKNIVSADNRFLINAFGLARVGTLNTKLSSGMILMWGRLNPAITSVFGAGDNAHNHKVYFHLYAQPMINVIGYDATMQGGVFNHDSPYTLSSSEVEHITFQGNYGAVLSFGSMYLEYFKTILSKEFTTGLYHRWGGIRVGVVF